MRGKIVNLSIGFVNILFGVLIILFTIKVPQDKTLLTIQEGIVTRYILFGVYLVMGAVAAIDIIQYYNHRRDTIFNTAYLIGIFVISFIFIKEPSIGVFSIVSGIIVIIRSLNENLVEIDSTTAISVAIAIMLATLVLIFVSMSYKSLGEMIKNRENKNELAYKKDYFKYITELGINEPFINVKKDGKYGYITPDGNTVIDFIYDYASPFVKIIMNNKKFEIALVCQDGRSLIILKNQRKVMSYRSESADENYKAKIEELNHVYTNILKQEGTIEYEVEELNNNIYKVPAYEDNNVADIFRYNYNYEYDLIVTQSNLGLGDKYELAKKDDLDIRLKLETKNLDYDENYLYLFSNGDIPFYETSKLRQGWFTSYGTKKEMYGKAQILDFFGNKILIRNYNNKTVYFSDSSGNPVSEIYKDIFVKDNNRYIVKNQENQKIKVIDGNLNKVFEEEFDIINTRLVHKNLYMCMNISEKITFNDYGFAKMNFTLINDNGEIVLENVEQIYNEYYELPSESEKEKENYQIFIEDLKDLKYNFVGDKFYSNYNN